MRYQHNFEIIKKKKFVFVLQWPFKKLSHFIDVLKKVESKHKFYLTFYNKLTFLHYVSSSSFSVYE